MWFAAVVIGLMEASEELQFCAKVQLKFESMRIKEKDEISGLNVVPDINVS